MISIALRPPALIAALTLAVAAAIPQTALAQVEGDYLYRVSMLRAAPGDWAELIDALEEASAVHEAAGDESPLWMRHSQGDQWDFMLIYPMGSRTEYHSSARQGRRDGAWAYPEAAALKARIEGLTAYHEDWFATSAPVDEMRRRFDGMGMFHIEMFAGIGGQRAELIEQRRMENRYYQHLGRQLNMIFARESGPNWDAMTIGFYTDLQTYAAQGVRFSEAEQDEAAHAAGFDGVGDISPYLRSLLSYHHDTIAVRVR